MSVVAFDSDGRAGPADSLDLERPAQRLLVEAMALCNDASLGSGGGATGDPTEIALLELSASRGIDPGDPPRQGSARGRTPPSTPTAR